MLKRLNSNSSAHDHDHTAAAAAAQSPRFVFESKMTVLLQGFGDSPSAKATSNNSSAQSISSEIGSLLWHHKFYSNNKNIRFWLPIALLPLVLLNSCFIYFVFVRGSENSQLSAPVGAPILPDLQNSSISDEIHQFPALPGSDLDTQQQDTSSNSESCDLSKGEWIFDSTPPLYTNSSCDHIQLLQNCLRNGKPDTGYLHWRWRPHNCDLPRFDPATFLELMRGKSMLFFGDSLARNHMQSLLCSLSQVERPDKVYSREDKDVKWGFQSYNFTLAIVWSPFLVKHVKVRDDPLLFNLHLDVPHPAWWPSLASYDFAVMSASQWFFRPSLYSINNTIFGCNEYSRENYTDVHFLTAMELAFRTSLRAIATLDGYNGTTFLRTASPEHFEHGTWSTGGKCNRTRPTHSVRDAVHGGGGELELPWLPSNLNRVQRDEARKFDPSNGSRLRVLDVTYSAYLRPDGHPGPYRIYQPYAKEPGRHVQNDCLHWCLPGPVDMWNQLLLESVKKLERDKEE
ncbi:protein trichome birefringence-like 26 [Selaginella moellendorffii]|nr:protein trichome birefringence-like 26 [Selaginella moellendorffii]|eukprot:XP_002979283.2 protein trichome birefringence-like 26 [Selaginella moellendorffii]